MAEKEQLIEQGFGDWKKNQFHSFMRTMEKYGRDQMDLAVKEVEGKTEDEVRAYAKVFFERVHEMSGENRSFELQVTRG